MEAQEAPEDRAIAELFHCMYPEKLGPFSPLSISLAMTPGRMQESNQH